MQKEIVEYVNNAIIKIRIKGYLKNHTLFFEK